MPQPRRTISSLGHPGFTLFELVLVLVIIAIALGVAAPALDNFAHARVPGNTAAQFVALAQYARTQAISNGTTYRINVDVPNRRWFLTKDDGTSNFVADDSKFGQPFTLPDGITMDCSVTPTNGAQIIEFQPNGRFDPATLHFRDKTGVTATVVAADPLDLFHIQS